jgi:hypothetical protein
MTMAARSPAPLSTVSSVPTTPTHTMSPDRDWAELPRALLWITVLAAVAKFKKWLFENHAGVCSSKRSRASTSFARGSVRVHDDSGTACESGFKREQGLTLHFNCRPVRSQLRLVAILFGGPFRSAGAGWIGHCSDVLERCRYARCCQTLCRDHAGRMDGLRQS